MGIVTREPRQSRILSCFSLLLIIGGHLSISLGIKSKIHLSPRLKVQELEITISELLVCFLRSLFADRPRPRMASKLATIGILSIGDMGLGIAKLLIANGYKVVTNASDRRHLRSPPNPHTY